jgi:cytochrome c oxidase subunit 1
MKRGKKAGENPWKANSLEWQCPSPPPHGNFAELPTVYRGPYEYSHPDRELDYWPQNEPPVSA